MKPMVRSTSEAVPWAPPETWWIITWEFGRQKRLPGVPAYQKDGTHGGRYAQAICIYVTRDELHRIVNRETRRDGSSGGVDVDVDVFFRVSHLKEQKLGNDGIRHIVVNSGADEDNAVFQETGVNVKGSFAAAVLLHHHGHIIGVCGG